MLWWGYKSQEKVTRKAERREKAALDYAKAVEDKRKVLEQKFEKKIKLFGFRNRDVLGWIWSDTKGVPVQERFTVEGAGSAAMLQKGYLRDASSFYGDIDLRNQYHLPGDVNLRAFGNQNFVGAEKILSTTSRRFCIKDLGR